MTFEAVKEAIEAMIEDKTLSRWDLLEYLEYVGYLCETHAETLREAEMDAQDEGFS